MKNVAKATHQLLTGVQCPFLKAAGKEAISASTLPTLLQTVGQHCPFLKREGIIGKELSQNTITPIKPKVPHSIANVLLQRKLDDVKTEGRYRVFWDINRKVGSFPNAVFTDPKHTNEKDITVWCNNDYLGMGQHPKVLNAMHDAINTVGAGSGGTRNISGTSSYHTKLEVSLANLHRHESSLVFSSGYVANEAALNALGTLPNCHFFSDQLNHASIIAGIRNSRAQKDIFRHNDVSHLEQLLSKADPKAPKIIVFESVYSMDGDIAPIKEILDVADKFGALTFIDEVHAVGLYGKHGAGVAERDNVQQRVTMVSGTLGKAFGCFGGYVTGSHTVMDYIRTFAPGFIFTTALPPSVAAGALASVNVLRSSCGRALRQSHQERASSLKAILGEAGLPVMKSESHIVPVLIASARLCKRASDVLLQKHGVYVQPINYPTVPRGTERLRFTPSPLHDQAKMMYLRNALLSVWNELGMSLKTSSSSSSSSSSLTLSSTPILV